MCLINSFVARDLLTGYQSKINTESWIISVGGKVQNSQCSQFQLINSDVDQECVLDRN